MRNKALNVILLCVVPFCLWAQTDKKNTLELEIKDLYLDFAIPEISAFSILNIEPNSITKPGNIKELALGITNYVNSKGDLRAGLAIEWAPFMTFNKKENKWVDKSGKYKKVQWKNISTSLATTNDSTNVKLAGALRFAPIDKTNPLRNKEWVDSVRNYFHYAVSLRREKQEESLNKKKREFRMNAITLLNEILNDNEILSTIIDPIDIDNSYYIISLKNHFDTTSIILDRMLVADFVLESLKRQFTENGLLGLFDNNQTDLQSLSKRFADLFYQHYSLPSFEGNFSTFVLKMKEDFKKKNWNKWALQANVGGLFESEKAVLSNLKGNYVSAAFTTGFPLVSQNGAEKGRISKYLYDHSQLIFQIKGQQYLKSDSINNNSLFIGGRLLLGNYDKRFSIELAYISLSNGITDINNSGMRYSIGTEIRIMDNYWLELAVGGQDFKDKAGVNILPSFAFRHAFGNENRFFKK